MNKKVQMIASRHPMLIFIFEEVVLIFGLFLLCKDINCGEFSSTQVKDYISNITSLNASLLFAIIILILGSNYSRNIEKARRYKAFYHPLYVFIINSFLLCLSAFTIGKFPVYTVTVSSLLLIINAYYTMEILKLSIDKR